jgi:hypothetical protein
MFPLEGLGRVACFVGSPSWLPLARESSEEIFAALSSVLFSVLRGPWALEVVTLALAFHSATVLVHFQLQVQASHPLFCASSLAR